MSTVAILGTGNVGTKLGSRLVASGVGLRYGARDSAATRAKLQGTDLEAVPVMSPAEAARDCSAVVVAVPAAAATAAVQSCAAEAGTCVVDATNPLRWDGGPVWDPPAEGSITAQLAATFPALHFVKGFNHFGAEVHGDPNFGGLQASAFFAGSSVAKKVAMDLANTLGFTPYDAGSMRNAATLENLAVLWIELAQSAVGRDFTFMLSKRN